MSVPKFKLSKIWYFVGALLLANLGVWLGVWESRPSNFAKVDFFDVGQGDALYIRTVHGADILIDGGPGDAVLSKLGRAMPVLDRTLEFVILTHPHADHVSGLVEVLKRYKVKNVMFSKVNFSSATYSAFLNLLESKEINVINPKLGQRIFLDSKTILDVFYPLALNDQAEVKDPNKISLVTRMTFGKNHVLLMADAGMSIEQFLLKLNLPITSGVLKVAHQGSNSASSPEFLQAVKPEYAVISVGQNNYGHPSPEVLRTLNDQKIEVLRTDEKGDIKFSFYPDRVGLR